MAAALGVGLFICAFQLLAIFGAFKPGATAALIAAGVLAAALQLRPWWREVRTLRAPLRRGPAPKGSPPSRWPWWRCPRWSRRSRRPPPSTS